MGFTVHGSENTGIRCRDDDLMDALRRTRVYSEASPSERADLETFLNDLRSSTGMPTLEAEQPSSPDID